MFFPMLCVVPTKSRNNNGRPIHVIQVDEQCIATAEAVAVHHADKIVASVIWLGDCE